MGLRNIENTSSQYLTLSLLLSGVRPYPTIPMATTVARSRIFLDLQVGTLHAGRVVIELFTDKTPKTCEKYSTMRLWEYTANQRC